MNDLNVVENLDNAQNSAKELKMALRSRLIGINESERAARHWRTSFYIVLFAALVSVAGNIYQALHSKINSYVVDRGADHKTVFNIAKPQEFNDITIKAELKAWLTSARTLLTDKEYQESLVKETYSFVTKKDPAYHTLNEFYSNNDPFSTKGAKSSIIVSDLSVVSLKPLRVYELQWTEIGKDKDGIEISSKKHRAILTIRRGKLTSKEQLLANPYMLMIRTLDWATL